MSQTEKLDRASELTLDYVSQSLPLDIQQLSFILSTKDWSSFSLDEIKSLQTMLHSIITKIDVIKENHAL